MLNWLKRRKIVKHGHEVLRHARHVRNYNEDIASAENLRRLDHAEHQLSIALKQTDRAAIKEACHAVARAAESITPRKKHAALAENLEVILVAIVVAMGIRTYFVQPFKIPTGSMQPTLYGIHGEEADQPSLFDRKPLKALKWLITGESYKEITVRQAGRLTINEGSAKPGLLECRIGSYLYYTPKTDAIIARRGEVFASGSILWKGRQKAGDHVFVNKMAWNFMQPRRGDVMVFSTHNIPTLPEGTHYIKRMCGLPGERISINPPNLMVNEKAVSEPESVKRVASGKAGYAGYQLAYKSDQALIMEPDNALLLSAGEYAALGDNTLNSRDSRYWGPVPQENLVGPAFFVYWPYSRQRWGFIQGH